MITEISRQHALKLFAPYKGLVKKLEKMKSEYICIDVCTKQTLKSREQNNLFHNLLQVFWLSGCSSFNTYDDLRDYYKRVAGLVKPVGKYLKEMSWADATKDNAKIAISMCIRDMDEAGVIGSSEGKKYEEILQGINEFWEEI
jgi:hypothetical protein